LITAVQFAKFIIASLCFVRFLTLFCSRCLWKGIYTGATQVESLVHNEPTGVTKKFR